MLLHWADFSSGRADRLDEAAKILGGNYARVFAAMVG
jgi:hypothetical protein